MLTGTQFRALRALRGMTQAELAAVAGVSPTAVAEFETGKRNLRADTLHKLCDALGVTATYRIGSVEISGP